MATLPRFTVKEYNNIARMDDTEHATWLLTKLEADVQYFQEYLDRMQRNYPEEGVPQALCDQVGQLAEDILTHLRTVDPAQRAEYEAWAEKQEQFQFHIGYAADSIKGGHC